MNLILKDIQVTLSNDLRLSVLHDDDNNLAIIIAQLFLHHRQEKLIKQEMSYDTYAP